VIRKILLIWTPTTENDLLTTEPPKNKNEPLSTEQATDGVEKEPDGDEILEKVEIDVVERLYGHIKPPPLNPSSDDPDNRSLSMILKHPSPELQLLLEQAKSNTLSKSSTSPEELEVLNTNVEKVLTSQKARTYAEYVEVLTLIQENFESIKLGKTCYSIIKMLSETLTLTLNR
jgi:hypothetical protein